MNPNEISTDDGFTIPVDTQPQEDNVLVMSELETFRNQWKSEVAAKKKTKSTEIPAHRSQTQSHDVYHDAKKHFLQGIENERNGEMNKAIKSYRIAIQLDPEIEQRMGLYDFENVASDEEPEHHTFNASDTLMQKFSKLSMSANDDSIVLTNNRTGIMHLPSELICYIFRWVASSHLDMKSIESLSETCRKFYVNARDQSIWKAACERVWGLQASRKGYTSWRRMFIERPHVHLDGIYISKVCYFRQGDPTVLSSNYEPFQCVEYYRYIRFFENNRMILYTSPDRPSVVIPKLNLKNTEQYQFKCGHYKCHSEKQKKFKTAIISGILIDTCDKKYSRQYFKQATKSEKKYILKETEFFLDLELSSSSSRRRFNKLSWLSYSCCFKYDDSHTSPITDISLHDQYPPFYYSKVKSYNKSANEVL